MTNNNNNNNSSVITMCQRCPKHFAYILTLTVCVTVGTIVLIHRWENWDGTTQPAWPPAWGCKCWRDVDRVGLREYFVDNISKRKWTECRKKPAYQWIVHINWDQAWRGGLAEPGTAHWSRTAESPEQWPSEFEPGLGERGEREKYIFTICWDD